MRVLTALIFFVVYAGMLSAQTPLVLGYAGKMGNSNSEELSAMVADNSGNTYITGIFTGTVDFDPGAGTTNLTASFYDGYLAKYDASGGLVFALAIGGTDYDQGYDVSVDASGNIYVGGFFQGTVDFDPGAGTALRTASGNDAFLVKYNSSGNFVYVVQIGGSNTDMINGVAVDASGNAYVTGYFNNTVDFDPGAGTANLTSGFSQFDAFVAKYNSSGQYVYAINMGGGSGSAYGVDIAVDASGNTYVTGYFVNTIDFDPGAGTANRSSNGGYDIFVAKYNSSGAYSYAIGLGETSTDFGNGITVDGSGNVYVTGYFYGGTVDFDPGAGTANLTTPGADYNAFLAKYNSSGSYVNAISLGSTGTDQGQKVTLDGSGNVYVTGDFSGTVDFDVGGGTANRSSNGAGDVFVAQYDASLSYLNVFSFGGIGGEYGYGIAVDGNDNIYVAGVFTDAVDFDPGTGATNLTSNGGRDIFLAKYYYSTIVEWDGSTDTDWTDGTNWVGGVMPASGADVLIPTGLTNYPVIAGSIQVGDIEVESGATVTIPSGQSLSVDGALQNDGVITVQSGGSLAQGASSTLAGGGSFTVQRSKSSGTSFISFPVNTSGTSNISPTGSNGGQIVPNTSNPCNPDSIDATSPYGNFLELREDVTPISNCAQSLWFVKSAGLLDAGRGYSYTGGATTITWNGTVNNGNVPYGGLTRQAGTISQQDGSTSTRGWHLIGNPYPSPIVLTGGDLTGMGFDAQIQRYNDATGSWISNDPLVSATIPVGQSFQVRKTNVGGTSTFTFTNDMRTTGNPTFYRQQSPREYYLSITLDNGTVTDESMVYFYDGATDGFDALYDANKLMGNYYNPLLYTVAADERMSYNALPLMLPGETRTVTLGVHAGVHGQFTLAFNDLNTLGATVTLEDTKLATTTQLSEGFSYTFATTASDANERFLLHFNKEVSVGVGNIETPQVKLYPNPVQNNLTLQLPKEHSYTQAVIVDITGKQVSGLPLAGTQTHYDVVTENLPNGVYYIKLQGGNSATLKFIKL